MDNAVKDFTSSLRSKAQAAGPDAVAIDPHFVEDAVAAKVLEYAIKNGKNFLLVGPTGCGKSSLVVNVCARLQRALEITSLDGETSTANIIAKLLIAEGLNGQSVTSVAYGPALRAYRDGKILLLEEVDMANPDILASLHRLMETQSRFYTCNEGVQDVIRRHSNYGVGATANTIGTGEDNFVYAGTKPLNQAFMNRFAVTIRMDYLPADKEAKVVEAKAGIDAHFAKRMVEVANEVRKARKSATNRQLVATVSTRDLIEWADLTANTGLSARQAAEYSFLNRINEADAEVIRGFVANKGI